MAKGRGKKVNRAELATVFGVSLVTIDAWVRAGCPFDERGTGKGSPWVFDTADVAAWRESRAFENGGQGEQTDDNALKRRKMTAETQLAELELAREMGLVAPLDQMERALQRVFAEIRGNLRNIPSRVASLIVGETDERILKSTLLAEIDLVLESLTTFDLADDTEADEDDVDEAEESDDDA